MSERTNDAFDEKGCIASRPEDFSAAKMTRTYRCPECGYDGFRMSELTGTIKDVAFHPGCPACMTLRGRTVMLVETSDPREIADAAD